MRNDIIQLYQKALKLWQSNNVVDQNKKRFAASLGIFGVIFLTLSNIRMDTTTKYIVLYFGILMFCISINMFVYFFYIHNRIKHFQKITKYFLLFIISLLLFLNIIILIPFLIALGILGKIIDFRAKKIDNLMDFLFYLVVSLMVILLLVYPNYLLVSSLSSWLVGLLGTNLNINLDAYCIALFLFLCFLKLQIDTFYRGLLFLKQRKIHKAIIRSLDVTRTNLDQSINKSFFDIKAHIQFKNSVLKNEEARLKENMSFDLTYFKNTLRKVELAFLIILFVTVALKMAPIELMEFLNRYQSDTINILTVFTLIMLYIDKRKEWK